jgi:transglutaminase-like putative cysteine protease
MQLRVGYELIYDFPQPTPMVLMLHVHHSRANDIVVPDQMLTDPFVPISSYRDGFGNWCTRLLAPPGRLRLTATAVLHDSGLPDENAVFAQQHAVEDLPEDSLVYLLGSRYCETDRLMNLAWNLFGHTTPGGSRVQAICDYVNQYITFNYQAARSTRTAWESLEDRTGVCRDFAHLAIAFCRCMNIPARYCTGYLGDIRIPPVPDPMDFAAWFEAYIGGRWYTFDPRNNVPRIGRVLIGRGRDATDVAISNTFGPNFLAGFTVWADEVKSPLESAGFGSSAGSTCAF